MSEKLAGWPKEVVLPVDTAWVEDLEKVWRYERARADAAMARLRVAVAALHPISCNTSFDPRKLANDALSTIGPLPEST